LFNFLQGLNASLFYDNPDIRSYVSLVPTSAITGEGIGNLLALIVDNCQNMLAKRLMYSEELQVLSGECMCIKETKFLDHLYWGLGLVNKFLHLA
jgi:translation initiation factor IF-2